MLNFPSFELVDAYNIILKNWKTGLNLTDG